MIKYEHEFGIKHLPKFSIGVAMMIFGLIVIAFPLTYWALGVADLGSFIVGLFSVVVIIVGGVSLADGIDYKRSQIGGSDLSYTLRSTISELQKEFGLSSYEMEKELLKWADDRANAQKESLREAQSSAETVENSADDDIRSNLLRTP